MTSKIGIVHPCLRPGGGSEAVTMWIMESLQYDYAVELITVGDPDMRALNECYGTHIIDGRVSVFPVSVPAFLKGRFDVLRGQLLARRFRELSSRYDLTISAYNVLGLKSKGLQFIGDFSFDDDLRRRFDPRSRGWRGFLDRIAILRAPYLFLGRSISENALEGWEKNITIANSSWAAGILKETYGLTARVVYPPVPGKFAELPWNRREEGFVCVGRLVPEKRIELILDILEEVRSTRPDIHLHIIGTSNDLRYQAFLKERCRRTGGWAIFEGGLFGDRKNRIIAGHKFGIHGRLNEPFGIAPAEMVKAGCLVWVPKGGGQVEIVNDPRLIYENPLDASTKIITAINDPGLQEDLRGHLRKQIECFSPERFIQEVKSVVAQALDPEAERNH